VFTKPNKTSKQGSIPVSKRQTAFCSQQLIVILRAAYFGFKNKSSLFENILFVILKRMFSAQFSKLVNSYKNK